MQDLVNDYLERIKAFYDKWKVRVNANKSSCCIVFGYKYRLTPVDRRAYKTISIRYGTQVIYLATMRSRLAYGFVLWAGLSANQMERVRIAERKALRFVCEARRTPENFKYLANDQLYEKAGVEPIDVKLGGELMALRKGFSFPKST